MSTLQETKSQSLSRSVAAAFDPVTTDLSVSQVDGGTILLRPSAILRFLVPILTAIVLAGWAANLVIYQLLPSLDHKLSRLMLRFDLAHEPSLPQWYSSMTMLAAAVLLLVIGHVQLRRCAPFAKHWLGLAALFAIFSIDEAIMIHEMAGTTMESLLQPSPLFTMAWIIPGSVFAALVALTYLNFLRELQPRTRWLMVLSGGIYLFGAVGMEIPGGVLYDRYEFTTWHYITSYAFAEFLEMFGIALFLYTLVDYLARHIQPLRFQRVQPD